MVDYSGDGLPALIGGEYVELQVFVAVLPYSGYTFAYATPDQTRKSWLHSIREMMTELQGATKYIILDNSTTCVCQASKVWPKYAKEFEHGLLFLVMSALFRQAAELKEDQDLTI